jgi:FkbM family methyltransferase
LSKINNLLLKVCLRTRGYNNFKNNKESGESFFISKILAPTNPKIIFDIGANVGNYSKELLQKTNAKIYSFEPLPTEYELLKKLSVYGDRFVAENKGVGAENKTLTLYFDHAKPAHASFSEDVKKVSYVKNKMNIDVQVVTLENYCAEKSITAIDFIKIDVEGFESEVFKGASEVFKKIQPKFIQIEFNWHHLFRNNSLLYFAEKLPNYDCYQLIYDSWVKRDPRDPLANIFSFSNFVFVRN